MSYISLYRKYRSQTFSDLVEQEAVIRTLQNAIKFDRIAQSYIFAGPRGTGKTSVARIFAKTLNCLKLDKEKAEPCNECDNCKQITSGTHMDVIEIDAASHTGVDNIRDLIEKANFLPSIGKWKIYIIDETHMLSNSAFNALLKTIEEPPAHVIFILATTDPHKILSTIQSRCQRLDFSKISQSAIVKRIEDILKEEKMQITEEAIKLIAKYSGGHMRDALSITDQVLSFSNGKVEIDQVYQLLGTANIGDISKVILMLKSDKHVEYFKLMDKLFYEGLDAVLFLEDMLEFLRQVLFIKIGLKDMVIGPVVSIKNYQEVADVLSKEDVYSAITESSKAMQQVKAMEDSRVFLEVLLFQAFTGQIQEEKVQSDKGKGVSDKEQTTREIIETRVPQSQMPIIEKGFPKAVTVEEVKYESKPVIRPDVLLDIVNIKHFWSDILAYLKKNKKAQLSAMLKECVPISVEGENISAAIDDKFSFHHKKLNEDESRRDINAAASEIFSRKINIIIEFKSGNDMPTDLEKDDFEENTFLESSEIPDSIKDLAKQFGSEKVEKV
ncbi:MAG: DNA polymerase III subunit gamma/tau [Candidatus Riflemargulisbacteria bacterium]